MQREAFDYIIGAEAIMRNPRELASETWRTFFFFFFITTEGKFLLGVTPTFS